jgi:hypothetical protein
MIIYKVRLEPFLLSLVDILLGVEFLDLEEQVEAYVDDVVAVGEDNNDLFIIMRSADSSRECLRPS